MKLLSCLMIALGTACRAPADPGPGRPMRVHVSAPGLPTRTLEGLRVEPSGAALRAERIGGRVELDLDPRSKRVVLHAPDACSEPLDGEFLRLARPTVKLQPVIALSAPASDVGYDATFEVSVRTGCTAARRGSVAWSVEGAALASFTVLDSGYRVFARTAPAPHKFATWPRGQIVPISPAERGQTRLLARWTSPSGTVVERAVEVSAAPRSRGLPNVALGERVLLAGTGYSVSKRPDGALADPMPWGWPGAELTSLVPDAPGRWTLRSVAGVETTIDAGRYDAAPLDCGRSGCHAAEAHAATNNPMTASLYRFLSGTDAPTGVACTFGCHTTGEPGLADGGFSHALAEFELDPARLRVWDELPRSLRRHGGVGCMACHGPTHPADAGASSQLLRAEVCAYCHDAPPRYGHVRSWRSTRLARSDERVETRSLAECARCHTTWGFLDAVDGERDAMRIPPDDAPPIGISCAACHAPHAEDAVKPGSLRRVPVSSKYDALPEMAVERSSACLYCHTPEESGGPSSAVIWAGQGVSDPLSGAPLLGPAPHAAVPGGCVGCHGRDPGDGMRGAGHDFRADTRRCSRCHAERALDRSIFDRARHLVALGAKAPPTDVPPHARPRLPTDAEERALALAQLVLEDRGAAVHNPRYAKLLLDRAASVLAGSNPAEP